MLLGDMIARLDDETAAMEAVLGLGDLPLMARVEEASERDGLGPGEFVSQAVRLFSAQASDDDWVSLIGAMGRTDDPGQVCLKKMIEFALRPGGAAHACDHH